MTPPQSVDGLFWIHWRNRVAGRLGQLLSGNSGVKPVLALVSNNGKFDVKKLAREGWDGGGKFFACGTCLRLRESDGSEIRPLSTMKDQYEIIRDADKVITVRGGHRNETAWKRYAR